METFDCLMRDVENAVSSSIDPNTTLTVKTDASEKVIVATLSQESQPVAFFARSLSQTEQRNAAVEKEAYAMGVKSLRLTTPGEPIMDYAIIEVILKWKHIMSRHFRLIADQKFVSFMFDFRVPGKVKNETFLRWRLELSCYNYGIIYRHNKENYVAEVFSHQCCAMNDVFMKRLTEIHQLLCHLGET